MSRFHIAILFSIFTLLSFAHAEDARAEEKYTLTVHHFLSPTHILQTQLLVPLHNSLSEQSQGQLSLALYPSMTLGGKPQDLYNQVRDGSVDIAWSLIGYTPGIFPRSEVFELPDVHHSSAVSTSLAMFDLQDQLAEDFKDVKLLFLHAHNGNSLHTISHTIKTVDDLRGLKLRTPSRTGAWMIANWNASPVAMPLPSLPQALSRKNVDGALLPFEVMPAIGAEKLTNHSFTLPNAQRFGTAVFMLIMNKERFNSLPPHLQKLILKETGENRITSISQSWEKSEQRGIQAQKDTNSPISTISLDAAKDFYKGFKAVSARWVEEVSARGINGQFLLKNAKNAVIARKNNP